MCFSWKQTASSLVFEAMQIDAYKLVWRRKQHFSFARQTYEFAARADNDIPDQQSSSVSHIINQELASHQQIIAYVLSLKALLFLANGKLISFV